MSSDALRLTLVQFCPVLREPAANLLRCAEAALPIDSGVLLTPELSVTGYDLGDDAARMAVPVRNGERLALLADDAHPLCTARPDVVLGLVERGDDGVPYNSAVVCRAGVVRHRHRKLYLPTYGMFDEGRFFGRGARLDVYEPAPGWRAGVLVCEDFWHPGLAYVLAAAGIDLLLVPAAAAGRSTGPASQVHAFESAAAWERIASVTAQLYGIYVALANRCGVEGGVVFAGGSLVAGPTGRIVARADAFEEAVLDVWLSRAELEAARRPYAHARDDDPHLILRELRRHLGARE